MVNMFCKYDDLQNEKISHSLIVRFDSIGYPNQSIANTNLEYKRTIINTCYKTYIDV